MYYVWGMHYSLWIFELVNDACRIYNNIKTFEYFLYLNYYVANYLCVSFNLMELKVKEYCFFLKLLFKDGIKVFAFQVMKILLIIILNFCTH